MLVKWSEAYSLSREMLVDIYTVCLYFIWHLHCISFIALAYGVMSRTYGSNRTGTTSFIGHNDAASYLVGYEGRRHGFALHGIAFALWIWDVSCMSWSMALGDIGKKRSLSKDWWRLISSVLFDLIYLIVPLCSLTSLLKHFTYWDLASHTLFYIPRYSSGFCVKGWGISGSHHSFTLLSSLTCVVIWIVLEFG